MAGDPLARCSSGLTPAHQELIRILAEIAVETYLAEVEADESADHEVMS